MFQEVSYYREKYMYTAILDNGDTVYVFENGTAKNKTGDTYKAVTCLDEFDEIILLGWEKI